MEIEKYAHLAHDYKVRVTVLTPFGTARFSQYKNEPIEWLQCTEEQKEWLNDNSK